MLTYQLLTIHQQSRKMTIFWGQNNNIFSEEGKVAFSSLRLKSNDYLPIKVYKELAVDPISSITLSLAKMGEHEGAPIQVLVSPAGSKWKKTGRNYIGKPKKQRQTLRKQVIKLIPKSLRELKIK